MLKILPLKYAAFIGIALLSFGCYLDYTIINIALPTLEQTFNADVTQLQWVMNVYFLALCIFAILMGRMADLWGMRLFFYLGAAIFTVASLIAGLAPNISWLIIGRLLQGIGAAIVFPVGLSLLPYSFPENERSKAIAYLASLGGIALAIGPILGGMIVAHWGWRWIFLINIPLAIVGYLFCFISIKEIGTLKQKTTLDWQGALVLGIALASLLFGLAPSHGSSGPQEINWLYGLAGLVFLVLFVFIERKQTNPLIYFSDFKKPLFSSGSLLIFSAGMFSAVLLFFMPLYLEIEREFSIQKSAWILFFIPAAVFFVALVTDKIIATFHILNTILLAFGLALLAFILQLFFAKDTSLIIVALSFLLLGSMWALSNTAPIVAAQSSVPQERAAAATGVMVTLFNMGGAVGLALAVTLYSWGNTFTAGLKNVIIMLIVFCVVFLGFVLRARKQKN